MGNQAQMKLPVSEPGTLSLIDLLDSSTLSDVEIQRLIGWQALVLVDLLGRKCITVRYAEQLLFNLEVVQRLERRHLKDCVAVVDWGMQLEDWEEHTPEHFPEALMAISQLAHRLLEPGKKGPRLRDRQALKSVMSSSQ
jgi:hypothetical protein